MAKKTTIFLDTVDGLTKKTLVMTTANGTKLYFSPKRQEYLTSNWEDVSEALEILWNINRNYTALGLHLDIMDKNFNQKPEVKIVSDNGYKVKAEIFYIPKAENK